MFCKLFMMLTCLCGFNFFDYTPEYAVRVEDGFEEFQINIKSFQEKNNICFLKLEKLDILNPKEHQNGSIQMEFKYDPNSKALMAIGHHKGRAVIDKSLLENGCYSLIINNHEYGFLIIDQNGVYFQSINIL